MKDIKDIISEYMTKRGVKDEHFITPQGWKDIAVMFAKECSIMQRINCMDEARIEIKDGNYDSELITSQESFNHLSGRTMKIKINDESILNAKSPV